ncbi:hypothetical protein IWQ62_006928, partial [Dispira parvispora]
MLCTNIGLLHLFATLQVATLVYADQQFRTETISKSGAFNPSFTMRKDYDYCNPHMPTKDNYKKMPGATLKFVQLFLRHGDRVPFNFIKTIDEYWECGPQYEVRYLAGGREFDPHKDKAEQDPNSPELQDSIKMQRKTYTPPDSPFKKPMNGTCEPGQLTERGMAQL